MAGRRRARCPRRRPRLHLPGRRRAAIAASIGVVLWQGPRLPGLAGIVTGVGLTWTVLFLRVKLECDAFNAVPGQECVAPGVEQFLAGAATVAVVGAVLSVIARATRRPR